LKTPQLIYKIGLSAFFFATFSLCFTSCDFKANANKNTIRIQRDSISSWLAKFKNESTDSIKKDYLNKAYSTNKIISEDSIKTKNLLQIADGFYRINEDSLFKRTNFELQELSNRLKDSNALAESYWNYGAFYVSKQVFDSGYYNYNKANKLYNAIGNDYSSGKMLYNMAFIEGRLKNYTGSEVLAFKAISKFKPLKKYLRLYYVYNHLGTIYHGLEEFKKAIFYYEQAHDYLKKIENRKTFVEGLFNNMGQVYLDQGDYNRAKVYFERALNNTDSSLSNSALKARLVGNLAYAKFLNGEKKGLPDEFYRALTIRERINNKAGIIASKLHLAEYYAKYNDTSKAISYLAQANALASKTKINTSLLKSFKLLSELDKKNSESHLKAYISLKEKLEIEERKTRNKFTRIRFETDEYVEETERLSQQKIWISVVGVTFTLILSLLYFIKLQRSKNKELQFEAEQQKYNEEIYELILKQQAVLEEGRLQERHRISEELHDGVLSKLFGTRMGLGFLSLKADEITLGKHQSYIEELQGIEKEIRVISHELKNEILSSKFSYIKIIESLVQEQSKLVGYNYNLESDDNIHWEDIDERIKMNFYRITQEALQNIRKYAEATLVNLNFKKNEKTLELSIADNGKGFDINKNRKGIGLLNIHSRMKKIGGRASISSAINSGTSVVVLIEI